MAFLQNKGEHRFSGIINDISATWDVGLASWRWRIPVRLDQVLEDLSSVVCQKARQESGTLDLLAQRTCHGVLSVTTRLGQILINLVNNIGQVHGARRGVLTLALEEQVADRVKLKFSVRDSGIGLTREQSARLFQAFSQADTSTTPCKRHRSRTLDLETPRRDDGEAPLG